MMPSSLDLLGLKRMKCFSIISIVVKGGLGIHESGSHR